MRRLKRRWSAGQYLCVGLDSDYARLPEVVRRNRSVAQAITRFNKDIIEATGASVCAYKPNLAFYESQGVEGHLALLDTVAFIKATLPDVLVILDGKRGDIGSTSQRYAQAAFDHIGADAVTVHPYLGAESLAPFLDRADRVVFVLVKTSNPGSGELQDLTVGSTGRPLYEVVARNVAESWNRNGNCGVVVGAPYPEALGAVRRIVGDLPILVPGIGIQGGQLAATVAAGRDRHGHGLVLSSSRAVLYASTGVDYAQAAGRVAQRLNQEISDTAHHSTQD